MHPLIENNREAIARLCRLHGVRSLEALRRCGSTFHVRIQPKAGPGGRETRAAVERVLKVCGGCDLRVIFPHPKGPFFTYHYHAATQDNQPMSLLFACRFAHNLAIELMLR
jgi:hypothetical protein